MGHQGVQEGGEKGGFEVVYRLPKRVRDVVGTGGGGIRGFGKGSRYLLRDEGGTVLVAYKVEECGRRGFWREKMVEERLCYLRWVSGPRQIWEPLWRAAKHKPFGCPEGVWGGR